MGNNFYLEIYCKKQEIQYVKCYSEDLAHRRQVRMSLTVVVQIRIVILILVFIDDELLLILGKKVYLKFKSYNE